MVNLYEILQKIGFDWQVALANLVNFLIILFLLKKFAFKPIGKLIKDRQDKINEGLQKTKEAEARLAEVDAIGISRLKETDQKSAAMMVEAQARAKKLEESLMKKAEGRQQQALEQAREQHKKAQEESQRIILQEAGALVREMIVKTVGLKPEAVDEALIEKAVLQLHHDKH